MALDELEEEAREVRSSAHRPACSRACPPPSHCELPAVAGAAGPDIGALGSQKGTAEEVEEGREVAPRPVTQGPGPLSRDSFARSRLMECWHVY